jgi:cupin domain
MPKVSRETATRGGDQGPVVDHNDDLDRYTVNFATFKQDIDATPLLKGLPEDSCQCPHWGYVLKGRLTYRVGDSEEVFTAGDAFYLPPGHIPIGNEPGSEFLQFSPAEQLLQVSQTIMKNMQAMQGG